jgi:cysteine-rich repeat protein
VSGLLYAFDPNTGALIDGYPTAVVGADGWRVPKTGAAAADESEPEPACGDGVVNQGREDCDDGNLVDGDGCSSQCVREYCGDGIVQPGLGEECEEPNTPGCDDTCHKVEICGNMIDDDGDGLIDCLDGDCPPCLPIEKDPGLIKFGPEGAGHDVLMVHGALSPAAPLDVANEAVGILLTSSSGVIYQVELPAGALQESSSMLFKYRNRDALLARSGVWKIDVHRRRRGGYTFRIKAYGDLSAATDAFMTVQWHVGGEVFVNSSAWEKTTRGWKLELPGE